MEIRKVARMQVLGRRTGPWLRLWLRARLAESPPRQRLSGHLIALISGFQDQMGSRTRWAIQEVSALDIPDPDQLGGFEDPYHHVLQNNEFNNARVLWGLR